MPAPSPMTKPSRSLSQGRDACSGVSLKAVRERARSGEAGDPEPADRGLGAAGDHDVGIAEPDHPGGVADRMGAGRAGGHDRVVRALEAEPDRDLPARQVDQGGRDEERADPARAALLERDRGVGDRVEAADAGADQHAGALPRLLGLGLPAGIPDGLGRRREPVDDEQIVLAQVLGLDEVVGLKAPSPSAGTWPAILAGRSSTSKRSIGRMPDWPAISRRHMTSTPQPSGVTRPRPVTTTRRFTRSSRSNPPAGGSTRAQLCCLM